MAKAGIAFNTPIAVTNIQFQMITYQINIIPKWAIIGHPLYFIDSENKLRNINTGKALQMQLKMYTKGYYLNGKFYSLKQLRILLIEYKTEHCPF